MPKVNNGDSCLRVTHRQVSFTAKLWQTAYKLRNNMDAAEYKHVVLGLIFLKYISDAFEEKMKRLTSELSEQMRKAKELDEDIKNNLKGIGYEI